MSEGFFQGAGETTKDFYAEVAKGNVPGHLLVHKFGANSGIPNGSAEIISVLSQAGRGIFLSAATTVRVKAGGNAADTAAGAGARKVIVQGIDSNLAEISEEITLAGASASSSTTASFWRIHRAYVSEAGSALANAGNIVIEITAGTQDLMLIVAGLAQTLHGAFSSPTGYDMYLLSMLLTVDSGKSMDFTVYKREQFDDASAPFSAARLQRYWNGIAGVVDYRPATPSKISSLPCDFWVEAYGNGGTGSVSCDFELLLVAQ